MASPVIISPNGASNVLASATNTIGTTLFFTTVAFNDVALVHVATDGPVAATSVVCNAATMVKLIDYSDGDPSVNGVTGSL